MERRGGCCQLMLEVCVRVDGYDRKARALIDTGAQTSLVRRALLPDSCFTRSSKPLLLKTVSGEELHGGKDEVIITLSFEARTEDGEAVGSRWMSQVTVHDGDIGCDLILGYPWLKVNRLDVQPWRDALQLHDQPRWVLSECRHATSSHVISAMATEQNQPKVATSCDVSPQHQPKVATSSDVSLPTVATSSDVSPTHQPKVATCGEVPTTHGSAMV